MAAIKTPFLEWFHAVGATSGPFAFLQGYPRTCFAVYRNGAWKLPPPDAPEFDSLNWDLFWDVRVFGPNGESHAWRTSRGWFWRALNTTALPEDTFIERSDYLWGTRMEGQIVDGWWCCSEERGAAIWIPEEACLDPHGKLPVRLKMRCTVAADLKSGLAGIVDAAIVGFDQD